MIYVDPTTGASYLVIEGQVNGFPSQYYTSGGAYEVGQAQNAFTQLAHHPTNTLGIQQTSYESPAAAVAAVSAASNQHLGYRSSVSVAQDVDELIDLTNLLYQQEESNADDSQGKVEELVTTLKNSLPSTPTQQDVASPMQRPEPLPRIGSLDEDITSQYLNHPPVKKPCTYYSHRVPPQSPTLPPLSFQNLPSIPTRPPQQQQQPRQPARVPVPSPPLDESSPCSSPPLSPKRNKKNYTKEFNLRFHELLNHNEHAANEWHLYAQRHKGKCTIKRAPCIKVSRGFCASYGHEFTDLAKEEKYGALGTRTECACMHKPAPLSSTGPARKQRQPARSTPYPHQQHGPSTPPDLELPSTPAEPSSPLTRQAWVSFLLQSAPMLHEGFNTFLGGLRCAACHARREFESRDEVIAYLMREPIYCKLDTCNGHMQVHQ